MALLLLQEEEVLRERVTKAVLEYGQRRVSEGVDTYCSLRSMDHGVFQKVLTVISGDRQKVKDNYSLALKHSYMLGLSYCVDRDDFHLKNFPQKTPGCVRCGRAMEARHLSCTVFITASVADTALMCEAGRYRERMSQVKFCLGCSGGWYGDEFWVGLHPGRRFIWQDTDTAVVVESTSLINSEGQVLHHVEFGDLRVACMRVT